MQGRAKTLKKIICKKHPESEIAHLQRKGPQRIINEQKNKPKA